MAFFHLQQYQFKDVYKINLASATSIVIASMIGTGVFTSLGFQLLDLESGVVILLLWLLGGILSYFGALCYAKLGSRFPINGGEYTYLSKLIHPSLGFSAGFVSATLGFSAPAALSAMSMGYYLKGIWPDINVTWIAVTTVIAITALHAWNLKQGSRFQVFVTGVKVLVILLFIVFGIMSEKNFNDVFSTSLIGKDLSKGALAICMIYISYAYSGWNAAAYMASDIENPQINLPKALLRGTALVTLIYVLLNYVFLKTVSVTDLKGTLQVGVLSAQNIFNGWLGNGIGCIISLLLLSSISSYILSGPRVASQMGEEYPLLNIFSKRNKNNVPYISVITQSSISLILIITSSFESVLTLIGFTLSLFTCLAVLALLITSKDSSYKFKIPFGNLFPLLFLITNIGVLFFTLYTKPLESIIGLSSLLLGLFIYFVSRNLKGLTNA